MDIGYYMQAALRKAGLSQNMLAAKTGFTQSYISQICLNKKLPSLDALERICKGLSMSLADFFNTKEFYSFSPEKLEDLGLSSAEQRAIYLFLHLEKNEKDIVTSLVAMLSEHLRKIYIYGKLALADTDDLLAATLRLEREEKERADAQGNPQKDSETQ